MVIIMPGTPYLEEPPAGLMTWPKLLKIGIPTISVLALVSWWNDVMIEFGIVKPRVQQFVLQVTC